MFSFFSFFLFFPLVLASYSVSSSLLLSPPLPTFPLFIPPPISLPPSLLSFLLFFFFFSLSLSFYSEASLRKGNDESLGTPNEGLEILPILKVLRNSFKTIVKDMYFNFQIILNL